MCSLWIQVSFSDIISPPPVVLLSHDHMLAKHILLNLEMFIEKLMVVKLLRLQCPSKNIIHVW